MAIMRMGIMGLRGWVLKFEIVISDIWQQVRGTEKVEIANFHFKYFLNDGNINRVLKSRWWEIIQNMF
jgi:hypothetical protein